MVVAEVLVTTLILIEMIREKIWEMYIFKQIGGQILRQDTKHQRASRIPSRHTVAGK